MLATVGRVVRRQQRTCERVSGSVPVHPRRIARCHVRLSRYSKVLGVPCSVKEGVEVRNTRCYEAQGGCAEGGRGERKGGGRRKEREEKRKRRTMKKNRKTRSKKKKRKKKR